ncbi:MAG TPA: pantetheine-phosphate adenylyltransferase [Nevskiales bacterium]|nr:pantetheine-phosphate adenylyltransferase [Nevskiales bacterium]
MSPAKDVIAAYSGTFDPITNGHADVIRRAARMFPKMLVAVAKNSGKQPMFTLEERVELVRAALADVPNLEVVAWGELIVRLYQKRGVTVLVRGARGVGDFEYEKQMALMNRHLEPNIDTIMLAPAPQFTQISSSLVREIAGHGGDISGLVPDVVAAALRRKTAPR